MSSRNVLDLKRKPHKRIASSPTITRSDTRRRPSSLRSRRRKERALAALVALLFVACGVCGANYISYLPQFTLGSVQVQGTRAFPAAVLSAFVGTVLYDGSYHLISRQNIFTYPKAAIERAVVANFPRIASAELSRPSLLSRNLVLTVTEREPFALWCADATGMKCYLMDESGFIFAAAQASSTQSGYVFTGGVATSSLPVGQTFAPGHLPGLLALFKLLADQDSLTPLGASIDSDQDFSVTLAQGFVLKASYGENASQLAQNLSLVLHSDALSGKTDELEYVDLRFGDRVYYKLKGQDQTSASQ